METKALKTCAIIVAAGSSSRMAAGDKMFINIKVVPTIIRTLLKFENNSEIEKIIVVTRRESIERIISLAEEYKITKLLRVVEGGKLRPYSVLNGIDTAKDFDVVLIHDGARPLVSDRVISDITAAAKEYGAAVPTVPVKDTTKVVGDDGFVVATPERSTLFAAQTPQGFLRSLYLKAAECVGEEIEKITDDASLFEIAGYRVKTVEGDYKNIKITTDTDIAVAENYITEEL